MTHRKDWLIYFFSLDRASEIQTKERRSRKVKRKIFSILFALVLVLSFSLVTAVPVAAVDPAVPDRTTAITAAADRLAEEQEPNGGFRMWIDQPAGTTPRTHNVGVTAIGILRAHELQDEVAYETALAKVYKFVVDYEPGWIQNSANETQWKEAPGGVNSWPDIHFLIGLAESAESDSSLLAAIQSEVAETTPSDILALAKARWDDRLNHAGAVYPSEVGTATGMAEYLVDLRVGQGYGTLIPWDLEPAVKSALALHEKYPEDGYLEQAQDITEAIYDCIYGEPSYLDINDPEEKCYALGLAGAIEAFTEAGFHLDEASALKVLLIAYQNEVGFWDVSDISVEPETESVQATAYAIMALIAQGDADARTAAVKGSNWLVDTQDELGGWDPSSFESGDENLEVDGEAAWALATAEAPVTIDEKGYYSIQSAIDSASPNDTINVAAGTYQEHISIDKSDLRLIGEDKETTIIDATQDSLWTYPKPGILLDGISGVTVSGFNIRDAELDETGNPWVKDPYGPGPQALAGILIYGSSDSVVEGNIFINNHWQIFLCAEAAGAGYERCDNNRIANNIIRDSAQDGVYLYSDGSVYVKNTEVVNNEISNAYGEFASGVEFWGWPEGGDTPTISSTLISGNLITGCTYGVRIREDVSDITGTSINFNNFITNMNYGVYNGVASTVDVTNNWWGHASGPIPPGTYESYGDKVSDNVDYEPWLLETVTDLVPEPPTFDKTLALKDGWTLVSTDKAVAVSDWVGTEPLVEELPDKIMAYKYTSGFVPAAPSALGPLTAIYVKTKGGGGIGFNYAVTETPTMLSKDLEAGWNLISIPSTIADTGAILSPLRYVTIGTQQVVGLTTLVSQDEYNQFSGSFYLATLTDADWNALVPLNPLDGYWANMEAADTFEVVPD